MWLGGGGEKEKKGKLTETSSWSGPSSPWPGSWRCPHTCGFALPPRRPGRPPRSGGGRSSFFVEERLRRRAAARCQIAEGTRRGASAEGLRRCVSVRATAWACLTSVPQAREGARRGRDRRGGAVLFDGVVANTQQKGRVRASRAAACPPCAPGPASSQPRRRVSAACGRLQPIHGRLPTPAPPPAGAGQCCCCAPGHGHRQERRGCCCAQRRAGSSGLAARGPRCGRGLPARGCAGRRPGRCCVHLGWVWCCSTR